jgi:hypothetical protein
MLTILKKKASALYVGNWAMKSLVNHQPGIDVAQNHNHHIFNQVKIKKYLNRGKNQLKFGG